MGKCNEEQAEIINEEDSESKSIVSNDSQETLWDPIIYDGGDNKEIQQGR